MSFKSLTGESQQLLTRLAHSCHNYAICMAAHIWSFDISSPPLRSPVPEGLLIAQFKPCSTTSSTVLVSLIISFFLRQFYCFERANEVTSIIQSRLFPVDTKMTHVNIPRYALAGPSTSPVVCLRRTTARRLRLHLHTDRQNAATRRWLLMVALLRGIGDRGAVEGHLACAQGHQGSWVDTIGRSEATTRRTSRVGAAEVYPAVGVARFKLSRVRKPRQAEPNGYIISGQIVRM
ncbi:hypothetical protein BGY98DRAFT_558186 [Russula aff. rugulosa BPL654]|nr:hypothetical protein BGY98DRAFT_558186 [Russula aff. rugulosa BPL654]